MIEPDNTITLATVCDSHSFRAGLEVEFRMRPDGSLRPATRLERALSRIGRRARSMTRWFRPRTVVSKVDVTKGVVTITQERWSWRRWRWEER